MNKNFLYKVNQNIKLLLILRKNLKKVIIKNNGDFFLILNKNKKFFFVILKKSLIMLYEVLIDMICIDRLLINNFKYRFNLLYNLINYKYNNRLFVEEYIINKNLLTISIVEIYKSAGWLEREIWDLFGIFFYNHNDLRRILTDYGFKGFALRKDFPLSGFYEIRYDEEKKIIIYEKVKLNQDFRIFNFINPW